MGSLGGVETNASKLLGTGPGIRASVRTRGREAGAVSVGARGKSSPTHTSQKPRLRRAAPPHSGASPAL